MKKISYREIRREIHKLTDKMSKGKDEIYTEFFICPNPKCSFTHITIDNNFCPSCGCELSFTKRLQRERLHLKIKGKTNV